AETAQQALQALSMTTFDCVVLDFNLPDATGYELLEKMARQEEVSFPPVIVYTGRALSRDEEQRLGRYSRSIIIKDARSPERLLDEVTLFLHQVESKLPPSHQQLLRPARSRDGALQGRRIIMPEMDGLTARREIHKLPEWKKLPIIALTAKAMRDDQEKGLAAGANDY